MKKLITHYRLWYVLYNDKIYHNSDLVMDICEELANDLECNIEVFHEDKPVASLGEGNTYHKVDILFCYEYPKVYGEYKAFEGIDDGPEIDPVPREPDSFPGLWQEVFISLLIERGLSYIEKQKHLNYSRDPFTDEILEASSPKVFNLEDIEDVFDKLKLPVPYEISPDREVHTELIYRSAHTSRLWQIENTADNIRNIVEELQTELAQQKDYQKMIIEKDIVKIYYNNNVYEFKRWDGFYILSHLVENYNVELTASHLESLYRNRSNDYNNIDLKEYNIEQRIEGPDISKSKLKRYSELEDDLKEAERSDNHESAKRIENEMSSIIEELKKESKRKVKPTPSEEKARTNVYKNIENVLTYIKKKDQSLYEHFKGVKPNVDGALKTGFTLIYKVPPGVKWKVIRK